MSEPQDATLPSLPARHGWIELIQMASLAAFAGAFVLYSIEKLRSLQATHVLFGVALFAIPFFLVKDPPETVYPQGEFGFRLNKERLATLKELKVPGDILRAAAGSTILDVPFGKGEDLREALYDVLGEERVRPHVYTILLHARLYRKLETVNATPSNP